jgi:glycosyltransferase involved in cell wall biosynthesis
MLALINPGAHAIKMDVTNRSASGVELRTREGCRSWTWGLSQFIGPLDVELCMVAQPLVSILIPSFNAERWIKQTLESAISQDYPRTEVIVVDDGSTDRTLEISRRFESRFVRVITQSNAGGPAARNTALAHAQGEYIQWLDHDDLLARNKISNQIRCLENVESDRVLFSGPFATFYHHPRKARLFRSRLYQDLTPADYFFIKFSDDTFLQPSSWLVSRKLSDLAGPWWELRSPDDDGEYFCRVVAASKGIHFVPEAICYWRIGNKGSFSGSWKRSDASLQALFLSTVRCIAHYRKLEDGERAHAACVAFLQNRLIYFYPDHPQIVQQISALAEELGGAIRPPSLKWQYRSMKAAFGWSAAKQSMFAFGEIKDSVKQFLDQVIYNSGSTRPLAMCGSFGCSPEWARRPRHRLLDHRHDHEAAPRSTEGA